MDCREGSLTRLLFDLPEVFSIPFGGEGAAFPVRRIFCVGRNYAAEMGNEVDREAPFYFTKSPASAVFAPASRTSSWRSADR